MFGFRNPGGLRLPLEQIQIGGESDCRNRLMHQMFLMIGLGERAGSGIPKIYSGWTSQHWRPPALFEKDDPEQTLLALNMSDLLPEPVLADLRLRFGEMFDALTSEERLILAAAAVERVVSHRRLAEISGLHTYDLSRILQRLVREGLLTPEGKGRGTMYVLPGESLPTPDQVFGASVITQSSVDKRSGVAEGTRLSGPFGRSVPELDRTIIDTLEGLDPEFLLSLETIAKPVASQRRSVPKKLKKTVLELCDTRFITLGVLEKLLNRTGHYLRQNVLNPLVDEQQLQRAFPTTPNDPRQAYTSAKSGGNE